MVLTGREPIHTVLLLEPLVSLVLMGREPIHTVLLLELLVSLVLTGREPIHTRCCYWSYWLVWFSWEGSLFTHGVATGATG